MRVVVRWVLVSLVAISVVFAIAFAWLKLGGQHARRADRAPRRLGGR